jgi:hypothetical protein
MTKIKDIRGGFTIEDVVQGRTINPYDAQFNDVEGIEQIRLDAATSGRQDLAQP